MRTHRYELRHTRDQNLTRATAGLIVLAVAALLTLFMTGCATVRNKLFKPVLVTNAVPALVFTNVTQFTTNIVLTNAVTQVVVTNPAVVVQTNVFVLPAHAEVVTNSWEKRPEPQEVVATVGALVPGYGTIATGAFGLGTSLWLAWLNRKNKGAAVSTIHGVEKFLVSLPSSPTGAALADALKGMLKSAHQDAGPTVAAQAAALVDQHTGSTDDAAKNLAAVVAALGKGVA